MRDPEADSGAAAAVSATGSSVTVGEGVDRVGATEDPVLWGSSLPRDGVAPLESAADPTPVGRLRSLRL